jgi:hypothetical protein
MKTKLIAMVCFMAIFATSTLQAQSFGTQLKNKVVNKLENKANEKIDKSIDSAVDKPVDKTEEKVKESVKSDNSSNTNSNSGTKSAGDPNMSEEDLSNFMNMMNSEVTISDYPDVANVTPSAFIGSFDMIIENYKKNGSKGDDAKISWCIDKYDMIMMPEMEENSGTSKMIINRKKGIMVMLTNTGDTKMGMVMKLSDIGDMVENSDLIEEELSDTKVQIFKNETQVIEGKTCYKVLVSDDEFETESWITENIAIKMEHLFGYMNMQSKDQNKYEEKFGNIQGWAMKSTSTDKKTGEKTIVLTKNIKQGAIPVGMSSTEGYKLMEMPDMSNFMNNGK